MSSPSSAERPGVYRGQCAEFCGLQHAHMALLVVADPPAEFEAWEDAQRRDARAAARRGGQGRRARVPGQGLRLLPYDQRNARRAERSAPTSPMSAGAATSPPASRRRLQGSLAAWIADPQTMKPGNNMPYVPLTALELRQLAAYLAGLK